MAHLARRREIVRLSQIENGTTSRRAVAKRQQEALEDAAMKVYPASLCRDSLLARELCAPALTLTACGRQEELALVEQEQENRCVQGMAVEEGGNYVYTAGLGELLKELDDLLSTSSDLDDGSVQLDAGRDAWVQMPAGEDGGDVGFNSSETSALDVSAVRPDHETRPVGEGAKTEEEELAFLVSRKNGGTTLGTKDPSELNRLQLRRRSIRTERTSDSESSTETREVRAQQIRRSAEAELHEHRAMMKEEQNAKEERTRAARPEMESQRRAMKSIVADKASAKTALHEEGRTVRVAEEERMALAAQQEMMARAEARLEAGVSDVDSAEVERIGGEIRDTLLAQEHGQGTSAEDMDGGLLDEGLPAGAREGMAELTAAFGSAERIPADQAFVQDPKQALLHLSVCHCRATVRGIKPGRGRGLPDLRGSIHDCN